MSSQITSEQNLVKGLRIRTVLQRCQSAEVIIDGQSRGKMSSGLLLLIGLGWTSERLPEEFSPRFSELSDEQCASLLSPVLTRWWEKLSQLRIFPDDQGRMNLSWLQQANDCGVYLVSQFTLFADVRKGNRPGFSSALPPAAADRCFDQLTSYVRSKAELRPVLTGIFGADMKVALVNDGPVTLMFDCSVQGGIQPL